jgi:hypothetical protein
MERFEIQGENVDQAYDSDDARHSPGGD